MQTVQTMKTLTKIRLVNWHYFQNETIDVDGSFLLSGENASGKSTILDAIQLVLTTSTRSFNLATTVGEKRSKRDLKGYVRCKTGEEGNVYLRTGSVITYVALEFYEESKDRFFTLGVRIESSDVESDLKKKWFLCEDPLDSFCFIVNNKPALEEQFTVGGRRVSYLATVSEAKNRFKRRLGNLDEKFFEMIPKSIAFKPMNNVKDFINKFILPEKQIDVDTLRINIRNLRDLQKVMEEVRKQVDQLAAILDKYEELKTTKQEIKVIDILLKLAEIEVKEKEIEDAIERKAKTEALLEGKNREIEVNEQKYGALTDKYNKVLISISNSECEQLITQLKHELDTLKIRSNDLNGRVKKLTTHLADAIEAARAVEGTEVPVTALEIRSIGGKDVDDEQKTDIVVKLDTAISNEKKLAYEKQAICTRDLRERMEKKDQIRKEVDRLKKKQISYPPNTERLKQLIFEEFGKRRINSEVRVLADLLDITDSEWHNAVEGYLNTQRFYLIVPPDVYDIAAEVYDRHKNEVHTVALVNTGALDLQIEVTEGSLAQVVTSENRYALAYVRELLNRVVCCRDVKDLKLHKVSITSGCMLYQNKAVRKIDPRIYELPFIGKYALEKQLEIKEKELESISLEIKELDGQARHLKDQIRALEGFNKDMILDNLRAPGELQMVSEDVLRVSRELEKAENDPSIIELHFEEQRLKKECEEQKTCLERLNREGYGLERDVKDISKQIEQLSLKQHVLKQEVDALSEDSPGARVAAEEKLAEYLKHKSADMAVSGYGPRRQTLVNQLDGKKKDLTVLQTRFKDGEFGTGDSEGVMSAYAEEYANLSKHNLIECEEKLEVAQRDCELEFRENFLTKMRENIEEAGNLFAGLNKALKDIKYGQDSYRFVHSPNQVKQGLYEMITSDINIGGGTLFANIFEERYHTEMAELFSKLTESDEKGEMILQEYTDYRQYLDYDIEVISNGKKQLFSKIYGEKSGGETQTPYYVAIAASFAQMYSLGESIRIMMLDEAFDKMDDERIASMMKFFKEQRFQVILATPPAKMEIIGEYVDDIFVVYREGNNSFIEAYAL